MEAMTHARQAGPHFETEAPKPGFSQALTCARADPGKGGRHFRTKRARTRDASKNHKCLRHGFNRSASPEINALLIVWTSEALDA